MNTPLGVRTLHRFGARHFASSRVGDYDGESIHWRSYEEIDAGSLRLASMLKQLGLVRGDRVGTFMWNSTTILKLTLAYPPWDASCTPLIVGCHPSTLPTSLVTQGIGW
jgi:fatty-acyl-CoA synthase